MIPNLFNAFNLYNIATGKNSVYEELKANEKQNYKVLYEAVWQLGGVPMMLKMDDMTGQIPDEKVRAITDVFSWKNVPK